MKKIVLLVLLVCSITAFSQTKQRESYYQKIFAEAIKGKIEVVLKEMHNVRVDIMTDTFAIEVDFAEKWAESIGQSLLYGKVTQKKTGVLLIVNGEEENAHIDKLMTIAMDFNITVWIIDYKTDKWRRVIVERKYNY
jgi:hypothetical protein